MTNELIHAVAMAEKRLSFSISIGGDRFPVTSLSQVLELAQSDPATGAVVYFGELGDRMNMKSSNSSRINDLQNLSLPILQALLTKHSTNICSSDMPKHSSHVPTRVLAQNAMPFAQWERYRRKHSHNFSRQCETLPQGNFQDKIFDIESLKNRRKSILSTRSILDLVMYQFMSKTVRSCRAGIQTSHPHRLRRSSAAEYQ